MRFSPDDALKHLAIQGQVRDDLLRLGIHSDKRDVLKLLQTPHLRRLQAVVRRLAVKPRRLANFGLPADFHGRRANIALLELVAMGHNRQGERSDAIEEGERAVRFLPATRKYLGKLYI